MPPKKVDKKAEKGQQKAVEKQKVKIAEDLTFGLKNKNKSKTVQKYIKGVQNAAKGAQNVSEQVLKQQEMAQKEEKKKELQQAALLAALFKGTEDMKKFNDVKKTDPQSIKEGQLIDIYKDPRKEETMDDWDEAKLEEVIKTKHGASTAKPTDIVCKYFLDALEKRQYGWFWQCPNGGDNCKYRHCLPPGYVLKRNLPKEEDEEEEQLEEFLERERAQLKGEGTKVTLETFLAWKAKKEQDRRNAVETARVAEQKKTGGRGLAVLTGRDLFSFDPTLFIDDAEAADEDDYQEDENYWNQVLNENQEAVDRANQEALDRAKQEALSGTQDASDRDVDGDDTDEEEENSQQDQEGTSSGSSSSSSSSNDKPKSDQSKSTISVNRENVFLEGTVPDLDELDDV